MSGDQPPVVHSGQIADRPVVYTTCPSSTARPPAEYRRRLVDVARWAEDAGCRGALIYTDNALLDTWLTAQRLIEITEYFVPLIAVQPIYQHPFSVARAVASLAYLHGRPVDLNYVAGGFRGNLLALGDQLAHDRRYARLAEYADVVRRLLTGEPTTFEGSYLSLKGAVMGIPVPDHLRPRVFVSGSSAASVATAETIGAGQLSYPSPPREYAGEQSSRNRFGGGIRVGVIAREDATAAWRTAHERFPPSPDGARMSQLVARAGDSSWQKALAARDERAGPDPYWLVPFQTYRTFCPYLVGSLDEVAAYLGTYLRAGVRTIILDVPESAEDLEHAIVAIDRAARGVRA